MNYERTETMVIKFSGEEGKNAFEKLFDFHRNPREGVEVTCCARGNEIRRLEKLLDESNVEEY